MRGIWIKRDMNKEERSKLKELRVEAHSKNKVNTGTSDEIHLESLAHESKEMVAQRCHGRSPSGSLKITYTNIGGFGIEPMYHPRQILGARKTLLC